MTIDDYLLVERRRVLGTDVVVRRPDGSVETKPAPLQPVMVPVMRERAAKATRDAGRGDIIDWIERTETYLARSCELYTSDQGCVLHGETCSGRR